MPGAGGVGGWGGVDKTTDMIGNTGLFVYKSPTCCSYFTLKSTPRNLEPIAPVTELTFLKDMTQ